MANGDKVVDYCKNCKLLKDDADFSKSDFCEVTYTVAPKTELKTIEVAKSGGILNICSNNPWRNRLIERMEAGGPDWKNVLRNIKRSLK